MAKFDALKKLFSSRNSERLLDFKNRKTFPKALVLVSKLLCIVGNNDSETLKPYYNRVNDLYVEVMQELQFEFDHNDVSE